jgi:glycosyltransferase A (GT-A) superfamily protein (DUF2064 family)
MQPTLIVFAREPVRGRVKTRLCPPLDDVTAAALYERFLRDVLETARQVQGVRALVAYTPESRGTYFAELAPDLAAWPQRGAGLGERLDTAIADALLGSQLPATAVETRRQADGDFSDMIAVPSDPPVHLPGEASVAVIGSDSPDLPAAYLREAFVRLGAGADVVLGPADDGGYYLIGLRARQPRLLREVPMSTPSVLADTLALARELGLRVELLPPWYDVDTAADLRQLAGRLRCAPAGVAPRTRAFLIDHALI